MATRLLSSRVCDLPSLRRACIESSANSRSIWVVYEFAAIPAATGEFLFTLLPIDLPHLIRAKLLQRTVVLHSPSTNFFHQRLVPTANGMDL